jgi:hypothetical protein
MAIVRIWLYGNEKEFHINHHYLNEARKGSALSDKKIIVLHFTATPASRIDRTTAEFVIDGWNSGTRNAGAHFVVEREATLTDSSQDYTDLCQSLPDSELDRGPIHCTLNRISIGIENINVGKFGNTLHSIPESIRSNPNAYYNLRENIINSNCSRGFYQTFEEKHYHTLILLLRYLCILKAIPRIFLGRNAISNLERHWDFSATINGIAPGQFDRIRVPPQIRNDFHGILSHCNIHPNKSCGGPALNRNRIYRGIADEWWLPIQPDGRERGYYTGPFGNNRELIGWGSLGRTNFADADINGLQETQSYYNLHSETSYFTHTEHQNNKGYFPIGVNRAWHGGVHFIPNNQNTKVHAASSGTIVAARLGRIQAVEGGAGSLGSPRFVLLKHAVYMTTEGSGDSRRFNYNEQPKIIFSLYMHLAPFDIDGESDTNPEWFNLWRSANPRRSGDVENVFNPNIEVMVGDHLGNCGQWYEYEHCLHFEIFSGEDISVPPWDQAQRRFGPSEQAPDTSIFSSRSDINNALQHAGIQEPENSSIPDLRAVLSNLRNQKCFHLSEWALSNPNQLREQVRNQGERENLWSKIRLITWYNQARTYCNELREDGFVYSYHPITFMNYINSQINLQKDFTGGAPPLSQEDAVPGRSISRVYADEIRQQRRPLIYRAEEGTNQAVRVRSGVSSTVIIRRFRYSI